MLNYCQNKIADAMQWKQINWINLLPTSFPEWGRLVGGGAVCPIESKAIENATHRPHQYIFVIAHTYFIKS